MTPDAAFAVWTWWEWRIWCCYSDAAKRLWRAMWQDLQRYCRQQVAIEELQIHMRLARTTFLLRHWGE